MTAVEADAALPAALEAAASAVTRPQDRSRSASATSFATRSRRPNSIASARWSSTRRAAGAKAQAEALAASRVRTVVAVSCNLATLARDARILIDGGYRLTRVLPVDQFLYSPEIEAVATFER